MPTKTFPDILAEFRHAADNNRDIGTLFERLIARWLTTDPQYAALFAPGDVWLWNEWPHRASGDIGIDIVAREAATNEWWAIQCKFYEEETYLRDIGSFLAASGKTFAGDDGEIRFTRRLLVTTSDRWSSNAERLIENQAIPVTRINLHDLAESAVDWSAFSLAADAALKLKPRYDPKEHQQEAINASVAGFGIADRGKLIMACGTGKTFTALRLAETMQARRVLFLAPSISLVTQTLREWTAQGRLPFTAIVVCSDSTRIFTDASKERVRERHASAAVYEMNDAEIYGETFYRLGFGKAVDLAVCRT